MGIGEVAMEDVRSTLASADSALKESISTTRGGINSMFSSVSAAQNSLSSAVDQADKQYENQVRGVWDHVKKARAEYPGFIMGAVALGVGIPSARLGFQRFLRNTTLAGAATYVVMYPQLWGKRN